jgi:hypothetical protein
VTVLAFEKLKAKWMKDRRFRVAYARLGPEFVRAVRRFGSREMYPRPAGVAPDPVVTGVQPSSLDKSV